MARCARCNKSGFFLKVNSDGLCPDCQSLQRIEAENKKVEEINNAIASLDSQLKDKQALHDDIAAKAKVEALANVENEILQKQTAVNDLANNIVFQQGKCSDLANQIIDHSKKLDSVAKKLQKAELQYKSMQNAVKKNRLLFDGGQDIDPNNALLSDVSELLSTTVELNLHYMDLKQLRSRFNQNKSVIKETLKRYEGRYTTKSNQTIYQLMVIGLEAELQNILYNINYGKVDKAINDVKTMTEKYQKITSIGNQSIAPTIARFIGEIELLYTEAVKIEYEYFVQKERIKEEQRALREQMRQEAAERKALEAERKKIEAEESKYRSEMEVLMAQMESAKAEGSDISVFENRIEEITKQLSEVEHKKEEILKLQHGKAGYVYIISNLGSFGDQVFKVGMTRRLEPLDRINELSGASVPFPFDIHSFIFSDDAVKLEGDLHKMLHTKRVNKVNLRKEFFNIGIEDLESLIFEIQPSAEFNRTLLAEQYNQSLSMDEIPDNIEFLLNSSEDEEEVEEAI